MSVDKDIVESVLEGENFEIISMEPIPDKDITRLTIVHDIHPDDEVTVDLVAKDEDGNDIMEMQFTGPDIWSDEEAKQCLQEVMDTLVKVIEEAIDKDLEASGSGSASGSGEN